MTIKNPNYGALRASFVIDRVDLKEAAQKHGVPRSTASRWKAKAKAEGDDWNVARNATMASAGGTGDLKTAMITNFYILSERVFNELNSSEQLEPLVAMEQLTKWTDMMSKVAKVMTGDGKLDKLAFAMELLRFLSDFIRKDFPTDTATFMTILTPFAAEVNKKYGEHNE